jgi:hypothetical protein
MDAFYLIGFYGQSGRADGNIRRWKRRRLIVGCYHPTYKTVIPAEAPNPFARPYPVVPFLDPRLRGDDNRRVAASVLSAEQAMALFPKESAWAKAYPTRLIVGCNHPTYKTKNYLCRCAAVVK